jgi:hypothetical protein
MDAAFEHLWRQGLPPFDGVTLYSPEFLPLSALRKALQVIITHLQTLRPQARLFRLSDWHEHDGFVTTARPSSWEEMQALLASEERLYASSEGDTYVRTAFFPDERDFYLRLYVEEDYDNPLHAQNASDFIRCGTWDITCEEPLAAQLSEVLQREAAGVVNKQSAKEYFDSGYIG